MNCEKCKDQDECSIYQEWLNTRDCCCPYGEYQIRVKIKCKDCLSAEDLRRAAKKLERKIEGDKDK